MEIIGEGLKAIGNAAGAFAWAWGLVYIVGIGCKTFLLYTEKATKDDLKDWFKFREKNRL